MASVMSKLFLVNSYEFRSINTLVYLFGPPSNRASMVLPRGSGILVALAAAAWLAGWLETNVLLMEV